jgi:hypothetical protein
MAGNKAVAAAGAPGVIVNTFNSITSSFRK